MVGTALIVDRTYFGGQLASGDGVTLDYKIVSYTIVSRKFHASTYVGWQDDGRRRHVEFGDMERLTDQVCRL